MQLALLVAGAFVTGLVASIPVMQVIVGKTKNKWDDKLVAALASHKADIEALLARVIK